MATLPALILNLTSTSPTFSSTCWVGDENGRALFGARAERDREQHRVFGQSPWPKTLCCSRSRSARAPKSARPYSSPTQQVEENVGDVEVKLRMSAGSVAIHP